MRATVLALSGALALASGCSGRTCKPSANQDASRFCVPDGGAANQPLSLEIIEGCGGCTRFATSCSTSVVGSQIKLFVDGEECTVPFGMACNAACSSARLRCPVGPLDAGVYTVTANVTPAYSLGLVLSSQGLTSCTVD